MVTRIGTGLASGLDIESLIKAQIEAERYKATELEDKVTDEAKKYNVWTEVETKVSALQDLTDTLSSYSTWSQMDTSLTDDTVMNVDPTSKSVAGDYVFKITQLAMADTYQSDSQSSRTTALGYSGDFTINGQKITVTAGNTLEDIRDAINDAADDMTNKVTASIVGTSLVIKNASTGTGSDMTIAAGSGTVFSDLGLDDSSNHTASQNLSGTMDGVKFTSKTNSNITNVLDNTTLNFTDTGTTTLTISHDTETIKTSIEEFVDAYNALTEYLKSATQVTLTSAASGGNDSEEEIDTVGVLQGDFDASSILIKVRQTLGSTNTDPNELDQSFNNFQKIGIWFSDEEGTLEIIDEDKLDDALENNFDKVEDLFRATTTENGKSKDIGVMKKLNDYLYDLVDPIEGTISKKETSLQTNINNWEIKIGEIDTALEKRETLLYQHFADMEDITAEWSSQLQYLMSALGKTTSS